MPVQHVPRMPRRFTLLIVSAACLALLPTAFSGDSIIQHVNDGTYVSVGFDHLEAGPHDLTMTLQAKLPATEIYYSWYWDTYGTVIWTSNDNGTSGFEHHWTASGVTGQDIVAPEFQGYSNDGMMYGIFSVRVSHLDMDLEDPQNPQWPGMPDPNDETESTTGIGMPVSFNTPDFPVSFPFSDPAGRALSVSITSVDGGTLHFEGGGNQLALYQSGMNGWEKVTGGIPVPPGGYLSSNFRVCTNNQFTGAVMLTARLVHANSALDAADVVNVVYAPEIDLDADSDNSTPFASYPDPANGDLGNDEDALEDSSPLRIDINWGDIDNDMVPGFADGINLFGNGQANSCSNFAPILLSILNAGDTSSATVTFRYSGSDPAGVTRTLEPNGGGEVYTYTPASGMLRIWTQDGPTVRNVADIANGGHFIKPDIAYPPSNSVSSMELSASISRRQLTSGREVH